MKAQFQLRQYGIPSDNIRALRCPASPALLEYLDLIEPRPEYPLLPDGVAETKGRPLLFFVDEMEIGRSLDPLVYENHLTNLRRRILGSRGERVYLGRILPGELRVVPVSLEERTPEWKVFSAGTNEASFFFSNLAIGQYDGPGDPRDSDFLFREMFALLMNAARHLALTLNKSDVLSLIGRALFFRFLRDRQIVKQENIRSIAPNSSNLLSCFETAESSASTSQWLDKTFNGDFLPLTEEGNQKFFDRIGRVTEGMVFTQLSAILRGGKPISSSEYQLRFDWGDFDFAHVPVGLLSQVYEAFCWMWEHQASKESSVYYTPRNIAATIVEESFDNVPNAAYSRILDPACGAGVFLVLAFRRIYRERWELTSQRPNTKTIRDILENQLTGFDISESALKLAALSLYLTAIELDPKPLPPEKLKFKNLKGKALFNHRQEGEASNATVIGSLGTAIGVRFDKQFDLILSNPPWTSLPKSRRDLALELEHVSKGIVTRRLGATAAQGYRNPDNAPDLPFLLKSTEWCKPGGRIAMVLPSRILFKREDIPLQARDTILRLIEITGIVNGSNLADTDVWPEMNQPFMLLFARNQPPKDNHIIRYITPHCDVLLNRRGEVRIDSKSVQPVELRVASAEPWLWKALSIGTSLDAEIIRRLHAAGRKSLKDYWKSLGLTSGTGYMIKPNQPQADASFLQSLPLVDSIPPGTFLLIVEGIPRFSRLTASRPRTRDLYRSPLVLMKQAPGPHRDRAWATLSFSDVAFNQSFLGYSCNGHAEADLLARYLHLFAHSTIRMHYALLTAPRFGSERRVLDKSDLDDCPFVPLESLSETQRNEVMSLSERMIARDGGVFEDIDRFIASLYSLTLTDLEAMTDTLEVALPYEESRQRAFQAPTADERAEFTNRLKDLLAPFFRVIGQEPAITEWKPDNNEPAIKSPFHVLMVGARSEVSLPPEGLLEDEILPLANQTGASQVILQLDTGVAVGILNQYRYWTSSRARLLSAEILSRDLRVLEPTV